MKTCCFCWNLRSGTIATGVFVLVTRTLAVILFSAILALRASDRTSRNYYDSYGAIKEDSPWYITVGYDNTVVIISVVEGCLNLLFSALLLLGVTKLKKSLLLPWIILTTIDVIFGIIGMIMVIATTTPDVGVPKAIPILLGGLLQIYMICCVFGYYKELKASENNAAYNAIPLNTPSVPEYVAKTNCPFYSNAGKGYPQSSSYPTQPPPQYNVNANPVNYGKPSIENKPSI